jgi:hypothetical protein
LFARALLVACLPALVCAALAGHFFSASFRDMIPVLSDEIAYWMQTAAFRVAGLESGYFTLNEQPSSVAWSHFGPQGPAFPMVYGLLARLTGWRAYSGPIFGFVLIAIAVVAWCRQSPPPRPWWTAALVGSYWPLVLYLPTTMQESLHFALAFAFAAAVNPLIAESGLRRSRVMALLLAIAAASLIRPTWALLLVALAAVRSRDVRPLAAIALMLAAAAGAAILYAIFTRLAAPYPGSTGTSLQLHSAVTVAVNLAHRAVPNLLAFVTPSSANWMHSLLRYQVIAALLLAVFQIAADAPDRARARRAAVFAASLLAAGLAALFLVGDVESWRDYRVMSPMLLVALAVASANGVRGVTCIAVTNLIAAPLAIHTFVQLHEPRFHADRLRLDHFRQEVAGRVTYDAGAPGWSNTLLVHVDAYDFPLMGLPAGIGISVALDWDDIARPPKSRLLLLRPEDVRALGSSVRLRWVADTPAGTLYENLDWRRR